MRPIDTTNLPTPIAAPPAVPEPTALSGLTPAETAAADDPGTGSREGFTDWDSTASGGAIRQLFQTGAPAPLAAPRSAGDGATLRQQLEAIGNGNPEQIDRGLEALNTALLGHWSARHEPVATGELRPDHAFTQARAEQEELGRAKLGKNERVIKYGGHWKELSAGRLVSEGLALAKASPAWRALPVASQEHLAQVFATLRNLDSAGETATHDATENVLGLLASGALASPQGEAALDTLATFLQAHASDRNAASDAVIQLSQPGGVARLLAGGGIGAPAPTAEDLAVCQRVSSDVARSLACENVGGRLQGGLEARGLRDVWRGGTSFWPPVALGGKGVLDVRADPRSSGDIWEGGQSPLQRVQAEENSWNHAYVALEAGAGNCQEHAVAVASRLRELGYHNVEIMTRGEAREGQADSSHAFVVVGRAYGSDPNQRSTWGENAIVVDAWKDGTAYFAREHLIAGHGPITSRLRLPDAFPAGDMPVPPDPSDPTTDANGARPNLPRLSSR